MIMLDEVSKSFGNHKAVDRVTFSNTRPGTDSDTRTVRQRENHPSPPDSRAGGAGQGHHLDERKDSQRPGDLCAPVTAQIGFVFQSSALWPHKTIAGNILFAMGSLPNKRAGREAIGTP